MKAVFDPSSLAVGAYARLSQSGLLETKLARKLFLKAYYAYKRYVEDPFYSLAVKHPHIFQNGHILDVGANVGYTACVFSEVVAEKFQVFAFEPEPENVDLLLESVSSRNLQRRIVPVPAGVGRRDGFMELWVNKGHHGDHRIVTSRFKEQLGADVPTRQVELVSVDSFLARVVPNQPVSFIKIDVQGYELEVCEGMKGTVARNEAVCVAFEYSPESMQEMGFAPRKLLEFFLDRGFGLYLLDRSAQLVRLSPESLLKRIQSRSYTDLLACRYDPRRPEKHF